jgi:hypothetical protein
MYRVLQWVKKPGLDVDHSLLHNAEVKNDWSYTATLPYVLKAWTGTKFDLYLPNGLLKAFQHVVS